MNRLGAETSPYLRQHADNPVDWWPWGPEALAEAARLDRPLLVSIGYSACHWCHVMAHESFEDPATAAVMNERFVNVKVDREERPDVDAVYMEAVQAMTGSGGWPLTAICTPDGRPFFTGTYFPNEPSHGRPSFRQLLDAIHEAWTTQRADLDQQASRVTEHLNASSLTGGQTLPTAADLVTARDGLVAQHDATWGGFGGSPKFPQTMSLDLLLRHHARIGGDPEALAVVTRSLDAMAAGGIHDHLGGGFARYSVDRQWLVPHFEKMLYDQALLARVFLHAWQVTGLPRYRAVLDDIVGYVLRDLRDPSGCFHAAEDADSEGVEGKFYVWTDDEIRAVVGDDAAEVVLDWWGVGPGGNFEGATILNRLHGQPDDVEPPEIDDARRRLLAVREERVHPGKDDKVLTEWNALMIGVLAEAGAATGTTAWVDAAVHAAEHLLSALRSPDGRWLRSWQNGPDGGRAQHLALAADHAALVEAFVHLAEATGEARWIAEGRAVADALLDTFWDDEAGGLFTAGHDAEPLVARQKDLLDNATPAANSLAAVGLSRLGALTGDATYVERAHQILALLAPTAARHPGSLAHLLAAADLAVHGIDEVVIPGRTTDLVEVIQRRYLPGAVLAWGEPYDSPLWEGRQEGLAYVCRDFACRLPVSNGAELLAQLTPAADA